MKNRKQNRISGALRKVQIASAFEQMWRIGQVSNLTMYDVAKYIGMKPSTHLMKMLMEMVENGTLGFTVAPHRSNRDKRLFYLCEREFSYPLFDHVEKQREIVINVNGRKI